LLTEPDTLFRWAEAAFLGIIFDCVSSGHVVYKEDVNLFLRGPRFVNLELASRSALVPVACRHRQFPISGIAPTTVVQQIDTFVNGTALSVPERR
jgi:hypothetical protein